MYYIIINQLGNKIFTKYDKGREYLYQRINTIVVRSITVVQKTILWYFSQRDGIPDQNNTIY